MQSGDTVGGRYELEHHLASGGMGSVWRARHLVSGRHLALKLLYAHVVDSQGGAQRFRREASAAAAIGHPGIVEVLDAGVDLESGWFYIAMELLEGESLRQRIARTETSTEEALALIDQMLAPLSVAHERGFVHRDLKPENVFVRAHGDGTESVVLLDFGIARRLDAPSATQTGTALGTPNYMAPEQAMSAKSATPRADVWSVGAMIYEVLAGRTPFEGDTPHAVIVHACTKPHEPVRLHAPHVSDGLAALVDRCLDKDPETRPANATLLRDALDAALAASTDIATWPRPGASGRASVSGDASTLRSTAPRLISTLPSGPMRPITGAGWTFDVPDEWVATDTALPNVAAFLTGKSAAGRAAPSARLVIDTWAGDLRSYADLGLDNMAMSARVHLSQDLVTRAGPAFQADATFHAADPPFRALVRCFVHAGNGYVLSCRAAPGELEAHRHLFDKILGSFRFTSS